MIKPQDNKDHQLSPEQSPPSTKNDQQFHFAQARQIIKNWPKWKRNISCAPISTNGDQANSHLDENQ